MNRRKRTFHILKALSRIEDYGVNIPILRDAAELSAKYINDKYLPDKAMTLLTTGALLKLSTSFKTKKTVGQHEVEDVVAKIAKIPKRNVSTSDMDKLKRLEDELKKAVFGQNEALHSLASSIKRARAGLGQAEKPIGSFSLPAHRRGQD
jgi:ATP-dependent Clp protease ATP-binding subunit ClpA